MILEKRERERKICREGGDRDREWRERVRGWQCRERAKYCE